MEYIQYMCICVVYNAVQHSSSAVCGFDQQAKARKTDSVAKFRLFFCFRLLQQKQVQNKQNTLCESKT